MNFATNESSRIDAIKAAAFILSLSVTDATAYVDNVVTKLRAECEAANVPNKTVYIRGEFDKFKIDTGYYTFD